MLPRLALTACCWTALGWTGLGWTAPAWAAKEVPKERQAKQWVQLSLGSLGFPGISDTFLQSGSSMLTVHFLDDSHLLLTFSLRDLVPRLAEDPKTDDDRRVAAEIVDLPSGKIGARTVWHMHDHGRYLWSLGEGRFLVRIGNRLSTMMPLANLDTPDPFQRTAFPEQKYSPSAVFVSPDGGLITVESVVSYVNPDGRAAVLLGDTDADKPVTEAIIKFFRVESETGGSEEAHKASLRVLPAGGVVSAQPVLLPLDSDGYLGAEQTGRNLWSMSFDEFGGKSVPLGQLQSSCVPRMQMVSRGEFVAFPCRGSDSNVRIASYGLDGKETWEEGLGDLGAPVFAFAPAAGRFALSHATVGTPQWPNVQSGGQGSAARQEVRVYQNASGDLLLRVDCSPVFRTAENFDLSGDGLLAAVVRNGSIAIYKLPAPSKEDLEDIAEVAKFTPPPSKGLVSLQALAGPEVAKSAGDVGGSVVAAPGPKPPPAAASGLRIPATPPVVALAAAKDGTGAPGASTPAGPRKAPTLLNPGEKPEFGSSNAEQPN